MSGDIANQPRNLPLHVTAETCAGGTFIVTGANGGLGFEAAKHLVALGSTKVIMAVRNLSAGEEAKAKIEEATGKSNIAEVWALDLASYASVQAFAKRAVAELDRIDALIENAAVAMSQRVLAEGHLLTVTVNVFSTFLLAIMLLPKMQQSAKKFGIVPHLSVISSGTAFDMESDWATIKDDPFVKMDAEGTVIMKAYPLSKLIEVLVIRELAKLLPVEKAGVVFNAVCPGLCKTDLSRNAPTAFREHLAEQHRQFGRTAEDGSRTLLHAAVAGKESHGQLLAHCKVAPEKVSSWVTDEAGQASQKRVWDLLADELESIEPGCVKKALQQ